MHVLIRLKYVAAAGLAAAGACLAAPYASDLHSRAVKYDCLQDSALAIVANNPGLLLPVRKPTQFRE